METKIPTMTAGKAVEFLREKGIRISVSSLVDGIESGALPFGSVICKRGSRRRRTIVYTVLLKRWADQREEPTAVGR